MTLQALAALNDNYIWVLHDAHQALIVDPGQSRLVLQLLDQKGLQLAGIVITHRHHDHIDGVAALVAQRPCPVYAPALHPLPSALQGVHLQTVQDGDRLELMGLTLHVLHTPGHMPEHVCYYLPQVPHLKLDTSLRPPIASPTPLDKNTDTPLLFCGDTLFSAGCGRVMDGQLPSYQALYASLQRIAQLPAHTHVCCAHEYTLSNLRFAQHVQPRNTALHYLKDEMGQRQKLKYPSLPSTLALEQQINPFLRCHLPAVQQQVAQSALAQHFQDSLTQAHSQPRLDLPLDVITFIQLRQWKNQF